MTDPGRAPGDAAIDGHVDEDAIGADERAKVEAELQSTSNPVARDDPVGEEQIHTGEVPTTHVDANAGTLTRAPAEHDLRSMPSAGADNPAGPGRVNEEASRAEARADAEREFARRQDWAANQRSRPDEAAWPSASKRDDRVQPIEVIRTRSFSFGQLLTMVVGAAFIALGVSAVIETGVDTPLDQPVQDVLGYAYPRCSASSRSVLAACWCCCRCGPADGGSSLRSVSCWSTPVCSFSARSTGQSRSSVPRAPMGASRSWPA